MYPRGDTMSDERETPAIPEPGAPVEEQSASDTAVQDAVDRAAEVPAATESVDAVDAPTTAISDAADEAALAEQQHREEVSKVDTELNLERPTAPIASTPITPTPLDDLPSAAAAPLPADTPARDGEIRISADHPMAALYMQSPMPPDLKGNRGAGVAISLLATIAFAVLYAGIVSVWISQQYPPSTFLTEGLLPWVTSWGFIAAVIAFFIGMVLLVLIFGRAGWWAYVIFSLFVGVLVWAVSTGIYAYIGTPFETTTALRADNDGLIGAARALAFTVPTLGAAVLAREVAIWFGAWIGARGRKVKAENAELLKEYETALAEVRAQ